MAHRRDLGSAVTDYVGAVKAPAGKRQPQGMSVNFYLKRHPSGLPVKTVKEVVDELVAAKTKIGQSDVYIKEHPLAPRPLRQRLQRSDLRCHRNATTRVA